MKKASVDSKCSFVSEEIIAGRVLAVSIDFGAGGACTLDVANIHNHDVGKQWNKIASCLEFSVGRSLNDPHRYGCVMLVISTISSKTVSLSL